jgi:hypothetical protein
VREHGCRDRDGILDLGLQGADPFPAEIQGHRVAARRLEGELLDVELPCAGHALPVDVPPVVAMTVLPETRELVSPLPARPPGADLDVPAAQGEAGQIVDLGVDHDLGPLLEPPNEAQKPERIGDPDFGRSQLVDAPAGEGEGSLYRGSSVLPEGWGFEEARLWETVGHANLR